MKRLLVLITMLYMLVVSGCGSNNVMDNYSFGNQVIQAGQSEITLPSPFELGFNSTVTSNKDGFTIKSYGGMTPTFLVNVEAILPTANKVMPTPEAEANQTLDSLKTTGGIKIKEAETTPVTIDNVVMYKQRVVYTAQNGVSFSFLRYIFSDKGILWNIVYQYPTSDTDGQQIVKYVEDKIQITHKKEG